MSDPKAVQSSVRAWVPWVTFIAGAVLTYVLSGASSIPTLQQLVDAREDEIAYQDQVMTRLATNYCDSVITLNTYRLLSLRDGRDALERQALQDHAAAELDLCEWHWSHPEKPRPWWKR